MASSEGGLHEAGGFGFVGASGVPGADFEEYRAFYSGGGDVFLEGDRFSAEIRAFRLDRGILFERRLSGVRHERSPERVAADGYTHYTCQLNLHGDVEVDTGEGFSPIAAGEAVLLDMQKPMRLRFTDACLLTVSLARELVVAAADEAPPSGRRVPAERTAALRRLYAAPDFTPGPAFLLAVLDSLVPVGPAPVADRRRRRAELRLAVVRDWVDANLSRRDLTPGEAARACGLSRAALYRLIAPYGGLLAMVRVRRLAQLERRLAAGDPRSLEALSDLLGFADSSQMIRQFRAVAGVPPGRYRAAGATARARWATWMGELR